ncbi:hypothetical protein DU002_06175 [Corallincola holothuriorum]|uniref:Uncharacterized protein n=1 Tax=Corallincola holothuriorum TaxID=2282215 RepID=A0A368NLB3_9GAMM|nr:hypothetical protein [Corallincola holothuriorum]RCU50910.1 hypothetical protein DU002_06175 [Corallincola holothuriorum]
MVNKLLVLMFGSLLLMTGCSDAPDSAEVQKAIERHIVWQPWQVGSVKLDSESLVGDSAVQYRFTAKLSPKEDLYQPLFVLGDVQVVAVGRQRGESKAVLGVADAKKGGHGWEIEIAFENDPFTDEGMPQKDNDVVISSAEFNSALKLASAELSQVNIEVAELTEKLSGSRVRHQEVLVQLSALRDSNRYKVDRLKQQFESQRQAVEERYAAKSRQSQANLNEQRKQQLIALNVKFEDRFTQAEHAFASKRRALDKAMVDNDRNYNILVQDVHKAYKADISGLDPDSISSDEYRAYLDARVKARDKALEQTKEEHQQMREQLRVEKEELVVNHRSNMDLLRQEKRSTLEEARRQQTDQKQSMFGEVQVQMDAALAELDKSYEARRAELLAEEKALNRELKDLAQSLNELETLNASKLNRRDALTKGIEAAGAAGATIS